jgi:hypothetical protein
VEPLRSADGFGLFVLLGFIWLVLNLMSRAGKKGAGPGSVAEGGTASIRDGAPASPLRQDDLSLESILRQIEAVKRQKQQTVPRPGPAPKRAPGPARLRDVEQDDRGPMGRSARASLPSAEEVEDRTSLDDEGLAVEERRRRDVKVFTPRPERVVQNRDEEAAAVAARRIQQVESRNRAISAADHASFDEAIRQVSVPSAVPPRLTKQGLREALVWREILGPPKALQEEE